MTDKVQHCSVIKAFKRHEIQETHLNIIKTIYDKLKANTVLNREKLKVFSLKARMS